jgi:hypothetical protein
MERLMRGEAAYDHPVNLASGGSMKPGDSSQGIGIFGRFGISDGKANALHQFYSFGSAAKA